MKFFNLALLAASAAAILKQKDGSQKSMHQTWEEEEKKEDWKPKEKSQFDKCFKDFYKTLWKMVDWNEDKMLDRCEFESLDGDFRRTRARSTAQNPNEEDLKKFNYYI